jgi:hypothetical protein
MGRFPKPCRVCGNLSLNNLCDYHQAIEDKLHNIKRDQIKKQTGQYSGDYRKRAAQVRATATVCHICGDGPRFNDPFEADHIDPANPASELKAAHRSCNGSRGNKPIN